MARGSISYMMVVKFLADVWVLDLWGFMKVLKVANQLILTG